MQFWHQYLNKFERNIAQIDPKLHQKSVYSAPLQKIGANKGTGNKISKCLVELLKIHLLRLRCFDIKKIINNWFELQ